MSTVITLDGSPARLSDLHRGFEWARSLTARLTKLRGSMPNRLPKYVAQCADVGASLGTLTIAIAGGDRTVTLNVNPGTPISLNGRPAMLEDLRRGFHVIASFVESTLQAVRIAATSIADIAGHIRDVRCCSGRCIDP